MPTWLWVIIGIVDVIIGVAISAYAWGSEWEQPHLHISDPDQWVHWAQVYEAYIRNKTPADDVNPPEIPPKEQR